MMTGWDFYKSGNYYAYFFSDNFQEIWRFMVQELNITEIRSQDEEDDEKKEQD